MADVETIRSFLIDVESSNLNVEEGWAREAALAALDRLEDRLDEDIPSYKGPSEARTQ